MLSFLPGWAGMILSLALLGFAVVIGTRITAKVTSKVGV